MRSSQTADSVYGHGLLDQPSRHTLTAVLVGDHKHREERLNLTIAEDCAPPMTVRSGKSATRLNVPGSVSARHVR